MPNFNLNINPQQKKGLYVTAAASCLLVLVGGMGRAAFTTRRKFLERRREHEQNMLSWLNRQTREQDLIEAHQQDTSSYRIDQDKAYALWQVHCVRRCSCCLSCWSPSEHCIGLRCTSMTVPSGVCVCDGVVCCVVSVFCLWGVCVGVGVCVATRHSTITNIHHKHEHCTTRH